MKDPELRLVGLTDDGTKLVLADSAGGEHTLVVDDELRAALRGDHATTAQLEKTMESTLRPRDIQARIRAGESPESVAAAAQTTLERIMSYATPVLAERAHVAERAQRASVRRKGGEGSSRVLSDTVEAQLRARNLSPDTVSWDAWRREDGRWTLVADFRDDTGAHRAEFVFDAPGRYVLADNDEARVLVGEQAATSPRGTGGGRRLSAVGPDDEELPLGDDAIDLVTGDRPQARPVAAEERTADLTSAADAVRSPRSAPHGDQLTDPRGDADWMATQATERPRPTPGPETVSAQEPAEATPEPSEPSESAEPPESAEDAEAPRKPARKGRGRASVPSWDEIMFGGGRQD